MGVSVPKSSLTCCVIYLPKISLFWYKNVKFLHMTNLQTVPEKYILKIQYMHFNFLSQKKPFIYKCCKPPPVCQPIPCHAALCWQPLGSRVSNRPAILRHAVDNFPAPLAWTEVLVLKWELGQTELRNRSDFSAIRLFFRAQALDSRGLGSDSGSAGCLSAPCFLIYKMACYEDKVNALFE